MTQQSLITRLKAVEEALVTEIAEFNASMYERDIDCNHEGKCNRIVGCLCMPIEKHKPHLVAALSDLRELIKEAEGQEVFFIMSTLDDQTFVRRNLYTALGEKP